uniref:Transmembrane protein 176B-like n=1 Tax=Fundulus heteroclitus TaxID=8078 RepID=A0A3Q2NSN9_FUNHE
MSVTMSRADGVTVFTLTSDPDSRWPPLCQILKSLCYSPACCGVSQSLRNVLGTSQSVLGVSCSLYFIVFGIICILSEKYPSPCLVIINVIVNLAGVALAITAIVLCSLIMGDIYPWFGCDRRDDYYWSYRSTTPSPAIDTQMTIVPGGITGILIVLSAMELCVTISAAVLGIKALKRSSKKGDKTPEDPELYKPLLEEVATEPAA